MRPLGVLLLIIPLSGCFGGDGGIFGEDEHIPDRWPDVAEATLQPGSRLFFAFDGFATQCTAGFLFRSPDNQTLYLAVTAHCLHPKDENGASLGDKHVGDNVYAQRPSGGKPVGTIAYDGWARGDEIVARDFALVELSNRRGVRDHAIPAVREWGGPTAVADPGMQPPGQQVFAYGASINRAQGEDNAKTGRFFVQDGDQLYVRLDAEAIQGDSGGPLLTWDGKAFGLLHGEIRLQAGGQPLPEGADVFTPLAPALAGARAAGMDVSLVTWAYEGPLTPVGDLPGPLADAAASLPA